MKRDLEVESDHQTAPAGRESASDKPSLMQAYRNKASESPTVVAVVGAALGLVAILIALTVLTETFANVRNVRSILVGASVFMVLGVGQALVMNTRGIDVSIGSIVGLSTSVLGGVILGSESGVVAGVFAALAVGVVCGLFNGAVIVYLQVPPIIATLATLTAFRGLAFVYMGGNVYHAFPDSLLWLGRGTVLGVPVPVLVGLGAAILAAYFLRWTKMGHGMTAIGGNPDAARVTGVPINRYLLTVYAIMGGLAALAGILQAGRMDSVSATGGTAWELHTIALVVVGGTSLWGGRSTMAGVVVGALILGVLENGFLLLGFDTFWQMVAVGAVVIVAVGTRSLRERSLST